MARIQNAADLAQKQQLQVLQMELKYFQKFLIQKISGKVSLQTV
jgi:hypothetical protein